jgi:hypothetical protein
MVAAAPHRISLVGLQLRGVGALADVCGCATGTPAHRRVAGLHSGSEHENPTPHLQECRMSIGTIILIVLVLLLIGAIPSWGHSRSWGYAPSGILGVLLIVVLVLLLTGRL